MNKPSILAATLGLACWVTLSAAAAVTDTQAPASPPQPTASANAPAPAPAQRVRPLQSPAVRAAQGAISPGELRPENPVVPQIAVPLRRARSDAGSDRAGSAPASEIDDSAARCQAAASDRERAACARGAGVRVAPLQR